MDSWSTWLWGLVGPLAKRVAAALGFGYVTFTGVSAAVEGAYSSVQASFGGFIGEVASLLAMAGFFDAMAISSGGIVSGLAWMVLKKWALLPGAGS